MDLFGRDVSCWNWLVSIVSHVARAGAVAAGVGDLPAVALLVDILLIVASIAQRQCVSLINCDGFE